MSAGITGITNDAIAATLKWVDGLRTVVDVPPLTIHARALQRTIAAGWTVTFDDHADPVIGPVDLGAVDPATAAIAGLAEIPDSLGEDVSFEPMTLLRSKEVAAASLTMLEAATGWGARDVVRDQTTALLFEGHALSRARKFDVINAARFARAAALYGTNPFFADEFSRFALGLQSGDGGFLSYRDLSEVAQANPALGTIIRCATATQIIWTLAELRDPGFRLMRRVAKRNELAASDARHRARTENALL